LILKHINGIAAYCDHPVRFGVVESINTTIKAVLRRARGMRNEGMLLVKPKWATGHSILTERTIICGKNARCVFLASRVRHLRQRVVGHRPRGCST
jgi:hypothetical protein